MFNSVFWDISGTCNSNCPYCCNGKRSISSGLHKKLSSLIVPDKMFASLNYLLEKKQISPGLTTINLYNWGEPFLHPEANEIFEWIANAGFTYNISTNGSCQHLFSQEAIHKLGNITFSMPGFSQESYNRIHGFNFETVLSNIKHIIKSLLEKGFAGTFTVSFHIYRFNMNEIEKARDFFSSLPVNFAPLIAYLNGSSMMFEYCSKKMNPDLRNKIDQELFTSHYFNTSKPDNYICPQYDILVLDESCNVVLCCGADKITNGYSLGNIYEIDFDSLRLQRSQSLTCAKCRSLNVEYIWHNPSIALSAIMGELT